MNFIVFDWIAVIVLAVFILRGAFKGFVSEASGKAGIVFGILSGVSFYLPVMNLLTGFLERLGVGRWAGVAVFLILAAVGYLVIRLFLTTMKDLFEILHLHLLDGVFGALLGGV
ncbi:MAG: CvpA family protein, partial [Synergistales bacterium]|nr:CvpA family protein [Synergistales bacterium]